MKLKSVLGISFGLLLSFAAQAENQMHVIAVNGIAETTIDPNMVNLQIESWVKAKTSQAAQETQAAQYKKVLSVVDKYHIKKEDQKSEGFSVYPEYTYDEKARRSRITGYRVSHVIQLTFRKIEDVGKLLDDLIAAGQEDTNAGVSVQSVSWDSDKKGSTESSIIAEAVRNARADAEDLAKAAGVKIKAVHRISHSSSEAPIMMEAVPMAKKAMSFSGAAAAPSTELTPGKIKIRADVQMEFEI
jgi:uncharacterized protein YggE